VQYFNYLKGPMATILYRYATDKNSPILQRNSANAEKHLVVFGLTIVRTPILVIRGLRDKKFGENFLN